MSSTQPSFDHTKHDNLVNGTANERQYVLDGPTVRIMYTHTDAYSTTPTEIAEAFPERLLKAVMPDADIDQGTFKFDREVDRLGLSMAFDWVLKSVQDGRYDELVGMTFMATEKLKELDAAAKKLGMWKLEEVVNNAQGRIASGAQKDASKSVEDA